MVLLGLVFMVATTLGLGFVLVVLSLGVLWAYDLRV